MTYIVVGGISSKVVSTELPMWIVVLFPGSSSNTGKIYRSDVIVDAISR